MRQVCCLIALLACARAHAEDETPVQLVVQRAAASSTLLDALRAAVGSHSVEVQEDPRCDAAAPNVPLRVTLRWRSAQAIEICFARAGETHRRRLPAVATLDAPAREQIATLIEAGVQALRAGRAWPEPAPGTSDDDPNATPLTAASDQLDRQPSDPALAQRTNASTEPERAGPQRSAASASGAHSPAGADSHADRGRGTASTRKSTHPARRGVRDDRGASNQPAPRDDDDEVDEQPSLPESSLPDTTSDDDPDAPPRVWQLALGYAGAWLAAAPAHELAAMGGVGLSQAWSVSLQAGYAPWSERTRSGAGIAFSTLQLRAAVGRVLAEPTPFTLELRAGPALEYLSVRPDAATRARLIGATGTATHFDVLLGAQLGSRLLLNQTFWLALWLGADLALTQHEVGFSREGSGYASSLATGLVRPRLDLQVGIFL